MHSTTAVPLFVVSLLIVETRCILSTQKGCAALPASFSFKQTVVHTSNNHHNTTNFWSYRPTEASLMVDLNQVLHFGEDWCSTNSTEEEVYYPNFRLDLISTERKRSRNGASRQVNRKNCRKLRRGSFVQESVHMAGSKLKHNFNYVQGLYYLRLSACSKYYPGRACDEDVVCSESERLVSDLPKNQDVCEFDFPSNVSADILDTSSRFPRFYHSLYDDWFCDISLRAVIPLCTAHQSYDTVTVSAVDVPIGDDTCSFADYHGLEHNHTDTAVLRPCANSTGCYEADNATGPVALLQHNIRQLSRNSSYCLFFRLNNPHCRGDAGCVFYTQTLTCDLLRSGHAGLTQLVTEPVFIGVVSATLFMSLALLMWTVIQCSKKKPGTPLMGNHHEGNGLKKPPRSLTEDDLEHISRLPSQEIVLVYFPDTKRFKELNRKLRDWLITLDVNDVKDIYDEKCSEEVLKNPEAWVRSTLAGPEKRIILVCSRLAYECLVCVKRGISSPKFVETDPHFGLLTRTIQYLDREMRGNYRNLICVRYEDLKICARTYSSEAFNIVPGTEYCLPQHLEDVYRWIHPRDPKPECWDENRHEVKSLLDAIRQYRHHDENIFTVQFATPTEDACSPIRGTAEQTASPFLSQR